MAEPAYLRFSSRFGRLGEFTGAVFKSLAALPGEMPELVRQMDEVGSRSLPLVGAGGAAIGAVLTLHTQDTLARFGAQSLIPSLIVFSMVQESGPLIASLMVAGRGNRRRARLDESDRSDRRPRGLGHRPDTPVGGDARAGPGPDAPGAHRDRRRRRHHYRFFLNPMPLERLISEGFRYIRLEDFVPNNARRAWHHSLHSSLADRLTLAAEGLLR